MEGQKDISFAPCWCRFHILQKGCVGGGHCTRIALLPAVTTCFHASCTTCCRLCGAHLTPCLPAKGTWWTLDIGKLNSEGCILAS